MSSSLKLEIITPERVFYRGEVKMVVVRTFLGEEGFLPGHLPAVKLLDTGELAIQEEGSEKLKIASISGGFVDVKDGIIIYTDRAEWAEEIDKYLKLVIILIYCFYRHNKKLAEKND